jgi:hypothetical protein
VVKPWNFLHPLFVFSSSCSSVRPSICQTLFVRHSFWHCLSVLSVLHCLSVCLSVCMSVLLLLCQYVRLSVVRHCPSFCLSASVCMSVCQNISVLCPRLSIHLSDRHCQSVRSVCLSIFPSIRHCLSVRLSNTVCPSVRLSDTVSPSVCPSIRPSVRRCLSVHLPDTVCPSVRLSVRYCLSVCQTLRNCPSVRPFTLATASPPPYKKDYGRNWSNGNRQTFGCLSHLVIAHRNNCGWQSELGSFLYTIGDR